MVLILAGHSEIGEHVRINLCHLTCLRHLNRSRAVTNGVFFEHLAGIIKRNKISESTKKLISFWRVQISESLMTRGFNP